MSKFEPVVVKNNTLVDISELYYCWMHVLLPMMWFPDYIGIYLLRKDAFRKILEV